MKNGLGNRRKGALDRLEKQLKSGKKQEKLDGKNTGKFIQLSDKDKKRMENEIKILKERV